MFAFKKMRLVGYVLNQILDLMLDHMLDHMIIGFVTTALHACLFYLSFWAIELISYSSSSLSLILLMLVLQGLLLASFEQNMSQNWLSCSKPWVLQIKTWWRGDRLKLGHALSLERLSPDRLALFSKDCNK